MLYVISGCSGAGKTTLVNALASRGSNVCEEPGREIVRRALNHQGDALPWKNPVLFARQCLELSLQRHAAAERSGETVFFDRSLIDAVSALVYAQPELAGTYLQLLEEYRYASTVFMAEPWPEHFKNDTERQHTYKDSVAEYDRLVATSTKAGYSIVVLPKTSVQERVQFVLDRAGCNSP